MDSVKEGIRLNLIELLEKTGKKRSDLAKACGVGKSAVSNWASGDSSIDVERIPAICKFFGITIDEFFGRSQELEPAPDLTPDEQQLVGLYRSTNEFGQHSIVTLARQMAESCPRPKPGDFPHLYLSDEMSDEEVDARVAAYEAALEEWTKARREGGADGTCDGADGND